MLGVFGAAEVLEVRGGVVHQALVEAAEVGAEKPKGLLPVKWWNDQFTNCQSNPFFVGDEPQTVPLDVEQPASEVWQHRGQYRELQGLLPPFLHQERHPGASQRFFSWVAAMITVAVR